MKTCRKIAACGAMVILLSLASACSKDDDFYSVDYGPVIFYVYVEDKDGNNLVDPDYEGNLLEGTKVICEGKEYPLSDALSWSWTRTYFPHFYGVSYTYENYGMEDRNGNRSERFILMVGEFDGAPGNRADVTLCLGDGTEISLSYESVEGKKDKNKIPGSKHRYLVDGVEQDNTMVRIVR